MKTIFATLMLTAATFSLSGTADAAGCIKGAIVGGVAGHMAGHGKVGAAAGCAIGHHNASKKQAAAQQPNQQSK